MTDEVTLGLSALADACRGAGDAISRTAPLMEATGDAVLDQANRWSRARFVRVPQACSDEEYAAPFPHLTGDIA